MALVFLRQCALEPAPSRGDRHADAARLVHQHEKRRDGRHDRGTKQERQSPPEGVPGPGS
jgi:hypothetical protein